MSTASTGSARLHRRIESFQRRKRTSRTVSVAGGARRPVDRYDAYSFALRVAYLCHLLSPRTRKVQHVQRPPPQRQSSSVADLVKDFSVVRDSKSTRFPKDFMSELDKRITNVLVGKEKSPEYNDALLKRSFAVFLNEFKRPEFRKSMDKDRRVEDLLLIFFSNATKELQKGKAPGDDSWKLMVDRHVALFVRLIASTLKSNDWLRDRPELQSRLATLENKLLTHDKDLSSNGSGPGLHEVEVPRSDKVKDMPLVLTVLNIFGESLERAQIDIDEQKDLWTEKAALNDLKMYQANLSFNNRRTLRSEDFDTEEAYELWRKAEVPDLSQMMLAIIQSNMELAKTSTGALPQFKPLNGSTADSPINSINGKRASGVDHGSSYVIDQPVDVSGFSLNGGSNSEVDDSEPYMFTPPDPRGFYRFVLREALLKDLDEAAASGENVNGDGSVKLLSKRSSDLLSELGLRWRIPFISRLMLFLDVARELYQDQALELDALDAAFLFIKEPVLEKKNQDLASLFDRTKWPMADYILNQQVLNAVHDLLLRDLFERMAGCYENKMPDVGSIMTVLDIHIYDDPLFSRTPDDLDRFAVHMRESLKEKAMDKYQQIYRQEIEAHQQHLEFFHVIQLGKGVLKMADKMQKRFKKTPDIMGVTPFEIFIETVFPTLASDLHHIVEAILLQAQQSGEDIAVQDGFDLYKELVEIRQIHAQSLPGVEFGFHIEGMLSTFVWRWVELTAASIPVWVENAVKQDNFGVQATAEDKPSLTPDNHSSSAIDIFRSFNQAVDQVMSLNWDDDYQYAKFMTAMSKAIGVGIERYCELLETTFVKEMDRITPAQEAQQQETRQEKWMRLAKDAISTKDKVEPFQFLPASFVKLNDVEYTMQHLDTLQGEMNVDACADVIKRHEPEAATQLKPQKYVFTIKIIEAEDLRACDANGLSDPYVVLGDEKQRRLAKTRIIYSDLNPRWDETFDITTSGLLNITATIWDWDTMGDHDCVGRTTIKLDPSHFGDFLPREYWLDLDTQGRLLVRVSMEGEKDDIQFYFGKAFRSLKRTEREMSRKITDKLSAYIHTCLSRRALRSLTRSNNLSISSVSSSVSSMLANRQLPASFASLNINRPSLQPSKSSAPGAHVPSDAEVAVALQPLFDYLNENFAIMKQTLTSTSMITVMTRVWKEVLSTIESLLVPPLSDKPSAQRQLSEQELDTVFKWLRLLFDFFHAVDPETKAVDGVPLDVLKNPKYHDLQNLNFFYYEDTDTLIRTSERMAVATMDRQRQAQQQAAQQQAAQQQAAQQSHPRHARGSSTSAPTSSYTVASASALIGTPAISPHAAAATRLRPTTSIVHSRSLGTMRQAKQAKRSAAQQEPSDDMILRILRMRPEATKYLRDRARQKERLAAAAAADFIVKQSLARSSLVAGRR